MSEENHGVEGATVETSGHSQVVIVDSAELDAVRELATAHDVGVREVPRRGVEPLTMVTLLLVGPVVAVSAVIRVLEQRRGGQVIDLRRNAPKAFYRTPDVLYGMVIIITAKGKITVRVSTPETMFDKVISSMPALLSDRGGRADAIAQAVSDKFGPSVEVYSDTSADGEK
ncbi:hypothetical protein Pma05_82410 [Plantactinospora mayteni]|uniref:Uncharacterized protein n=1 Tax=Plantactinospora mayteni TaxID=566021 RepID=A0ABQ4F430_9ACTN|nr:hypothetical protein Pma05_82410 [Plantactinospora mayteni]